MQSVPVVPSSYRGRFAPSPTGALHFGSLVAAFGSWLFARQARGEWLVRIEDLDPPREIQGAADQQLQTLAAFGLVPDGPVWRQSTRGAAYQDALDRLLASGAAFECHCSRAEVTRTGGVHRDCVAKVRRRNPAVRLRVPPGPVAFGDAVQGPITQDVGAAVGDVVLRRADGFWAYQLAVVVDDAAQGVTDIVRGADLLDSTARQILLQRALDLPTPRYAHLPLIVDARGHKLSKSLASLPVDASDPLPALRIAWQALGQSAPAVAKAPTVDALLRCAREAFDIRTIPRKPQVPSNDIR
jgi:glutamyl-Q tRNA(Asp) synthetase